MTPLDFVKREFNIEDKHINNDDIGYFSAVELAELISDYTQQQVKVEPEVILPERNFFGQWISTNDKMPKRGQQVIWYHPEIDEGRNQLREYVRIDSFDLPSRPASHWMALPPLPKP